MKFLASAALAAIMAASVPHAVLAQDVVSSNFKRDKNVSVRQRPRPDYEAIGIKTGGFTVYPRVTLEAERNDNIYAVASNEDADTIWRVKPEVAVRSNWSRHALGAFASASINRYNKFDTENTEEYNLGVNGRVDITRGSNVSGLVRYQRLTEPRTAPTAPTSSNAPVEYDLVTSNVTAVKEFNRLRLTGKLDDYDYNYHDTNIDQDFRDRNEFNFSGKAEYAVSPDTALYVSLVGNKKDYDLTSTSTRDSDGYVVTAGANFEISQVVRGDVEAGYMKQSYDNATFDKLDGFNARGRIEWFPTQLTTVTLNGSRTIEEATAANSPGYISGNISASVDHELLRNVLLSARASYGKDDYAEIDRNDKRTGAGASVAYLVNRNVGLFLTYTYLKQESTGANFGSNFTDNKLAASVALQF